MSDIEIKNYGAKFDFDAVRWNYSDEFSDIKAKYNKSIDGMKALERYIKQVLDIVDSITEDKDLSDYAKKDSPFFTGYPTVQTPLLYDDSNKIVNTEWVNKMLQPYLKTQSPNMSGSPTSTTPDIDDDSNRIATTEWVNQVVKSNYASIESPTFTGKVTVPTPSSNSADKSAVNTEWVNNKINTKLSNYAPIDSPSFIGTPTAPTPVENANPLQVVNVEYLENTINTKIAESKANLFETQVYSGVADNDSRISIPKGFGYGQCRFMVSVNSFNITKDIGTISKWEEHCSVGADGLVSCYVDYVATNGTGRFFGKANYLVIASRK